jgi:endoglucanase
MKSVGLFISILLVTFSSSYAQTGTGDDFQRTTLGSAWTPDANNVNSSNVNYTALAISNNALKVTSYQNAGVNYMGFTYTFSPIDITDAPYVSLKINTSTAFVLRIDAIDNQGHATNQTDTRVSIAGNGVYTDYLFDFTNKFTKAYPPPVVPVNSTQITKITFMVNPGQAGSNMIFFIDSVMIGSRAKANYVGGSKGIKLNQLGFFASGNKNAVVNGATGNNFYIVNEAMTDTVYTGILGAAKNWSYSSESVQLADFTAFKTPGRYKMQVQGLTSASYPFVISPTPLNPISKGLIRGFYYQRASIPLESQYAGTWARAEGHPDNQVLIHNSAATSVRPTGAKISSPKGWYDAGDYNKYVVNAGISTYTLLACYEHFPTYYDTLNLNIPESGNTIPDVLDEALWEIRWLFTMQDPYDGAVYHKLTNANFDGDNVMPADATTPRYVVQKSTAAALDFASVMAQSARIFANFPNELPGLADSCIISAQNAYSWAINNPSVTYNQSKLTNPAITTGTYADGYLVDEFQWAASELFTTTLKPEYYSSSSFSSNVNVPGWANVSTLGLISMAHNRKKIVDSLANPNDTTTMMNKIISFADTYAGYANGYTSIALGSKPVSTNSAYGVAMGTNANDFQWGSNSVAANEALILIQAFNYTKDTTYLKAALSNVDYILGRNAVGYCFVTGFGSLSPLHPSHRPSEADGIVAPVPGLLAAGPNPQQNDGCPGYPSSLPALSYMDTDCSYSTNEIAINWNAPLAYITGAVQSIYSAIEPEAKDYMVVLSTVNPNTTLKNVHFNVYPNPTNGNLYAEKPFDLTNPPVILDLNGREYNVSSDWTGDNIQVNTSNLKEGMYMIRLQGENGVAVQKFTVIK